MIYTLLVVEHLCQQERLSVLQLDYAPSGDRQLNYSSWHALGVFALIDYYLIWV